MDKDLRGILIAVVFMVLGIPLVLGVSDWLTSSSKVYACVEVLIERDDINYDGWTWTTNEGLILGYSEEEDEKVWNLPGCVNP